jgi:hypothetical protein
VNKVIAKGKEILLFHITKWIQPIMFTTLRLNCKTFLIIWPGDRVCNGVRWQPKPGPSLWIVGDRVLCSLMFHVKTMVRGLL